VQHYPNSAGSVLQIRNPTEVAFFNNSCNAATQPCCGTRPRMAQYNLTWPDPPISCYVPDYTAPSTFTLAVRARMRRPQGRALPLGRACQRDTSVPRRSPDRLTALALVRDRAWLDLPAGLHPLGMC